MGPLKDCLSFALLLTKTASGVKLASNGPWDLKAGRGVRAAFPSRSSVVMPAVRRAMRASRLATTPKNASVHYALGLTLVRQHRNREAVVELRQAASLAPGEPRYAYVYGVALHGTGRQEEGIKVLAAAQRRFTGDVDLLQALATMEQERGRREAALGYARALVALTPEDLEARALLQALER